MKALITITITLLLVIAISLLLDISFIAENWLRYSVVVILAILVLAIGGKIAWMQIEELKNNN